MEGSSLSDPNVISLLNRDFIPLLADCDEYGFPEGLPAIEKYRGVWKSFSARKWGIATSAVVDSTGTRLLGQSGSGFFWEWKTATNYWPDKFMDYLRKSLARAI
jgi:hypothetical protein